MNRILFTLLTTLSCAISYAGPFDGHRIPGVRPGVRPVVRPGSNHGDFGRPGGGEIVSFGTFIDVNGDGMPDRCRRVSQGIACLVNGNDEMWTYNFNDAQDWNRPEYGYVIRYADVNGDGLTDVCGRGAAGIVCALSDGYQFREWTNWTRYFSNGNGFANPQFYSTIRIDDVNGDGMADICANSPQGYICMYSNGYSFR